jgi:hypothetical protein
MFHLINLEKRNKNRYIVMISKQKERPFDTFQVMSS